MKKNKEIVSNKKSQRWLLTLSLSSIFFLVPCLQAEEKTIEELFENSMMAVASYVPLKAGDGNDLDMKASLLKHDDWKEDPKKIEIFVDRFNLLHHLPDTPTSSFSATIFRRKNDTNQVTFSLKGSAEKWGDLAVADGAGIFLSGVPQFQVADMYNYVQQLKAPLNGNYSYVKPTLFQAFNLEFGQKNNGAGYTDWFSGKTVNGVGHSLGGNLTHAFGRTFSQFANDA